MRQGGCGGHFPLRCFLVTVRASGAPHFPWLLRTAQRTWAKSLAALAHHSEDGTQAIRKQMWPRLVGVGATSYPMASSEPHKYLVLCPYLVFCPWSIRGVGVVPQTSCLVRIEIPDAPKGVHPRHTACALTTSQGGDGTHEPDTNLSIYLTRPSWPAELPEIDSLGPGEGPTALMHNFCKLDNMNILMRKRSIRPHSVQSL